MNLTNPSLAEVQKLVNQSFPAVRARLVRDFDLEVWVPPASGANSWWKSGKIGWDDAVTASQSWIQVRHCLTHGLTSGWRTEVWPGPVTKGINANNAVPAASDVLRAMPGGKHSLVVHDAITCARIFRDGAEAVANQVAAELGGKALNWSQVPDFPLDSAAG